jgi:hypothetical protein
VSALDPVNGENLFHAAEAYALCVERLKREISPVDGPAVRTATENRYAVRAVELLKQANGMGYFKDPTHRAAFTENPNVDALRQRADFQKLLGEITPAAPKAK